MLEPEREHIAVQARRLADEGLVMGTAGNLSLRVGGLVAITAAGAALGELTAQQVAVVPMDGELTAGELRPSSELELHLGVYRRFDAGAVVHTHAPMATALSCVIDELPVIHYGMLPLGGSVRVAPYATYGSPELAQATLEALRGRNAALMANHGAIAHAHDLKTAVEHSRLLEWASTLFWRAAALGTPRSLDAEQQEAALAAALERGYGTTRRIRE